MRNFKQDGNGSMNYVKKHYLKDGIPHYYVTDHLDNTRVKYRTDFTCSSSTAGSLNYKIENINEYYAYGKTLREYVNSNTEKYLTTYHERDKETSLDYRGARYYDSEIGRFLSVDTMAINNCSTNPYVYVSNNPTNYIDPDGKQFIFWTTTTTVTVPVTYGISELVLTNGSQYSIPKTVVEIGNRIRTAKAPAPKVEEVLRTLTKEQTKAMKPEYKASSETPNDFSKSSNDNLSTYDMDFASGISGNSFPLANLSTGFQIGIGGYLMYRFYQTAKDIVEIPLQIPKEVKNAPVQFEPKKK